MRRRLAALVLCAFCAGCALTPHVHDGPDRHDDRDRPTVTTTSTTEPVVNCAALGCPGNPPA